MNEFTQNASNLADIEIYIKKWNSENVDLNERLNNKIENTNNNIKIVINSYKKDENKENDNIDNFVINNDLKKDNKNDKNNIEKEEKKESNNNNDNNKK